MDPIFWTAAVATALHFFASFTFGKTVTDAIRARGIDPELMRQHHEKCVMLGLIALAVLHR